MTRDGRQLLAALAEAGFTYPELGATRGSLPPGYHHRVRQAGLGPGQATFDRAAAALSGWAMHRAAGLRVTASGPAEPGAVVAMALGWGPARITACCRVVYTVREPGRHGFGYGTLPGHPESGEEAFLVELGPGGDVTFTIRAFSRPATALARSAGPAGRLVQDYFTRRYLRALQRLAS
ncbi:MAG TPA: DUF1990 domain-containing protein [Streptosporangiaceae bacterium]